MHSANQSDGACLSDLTLSYLPTNVHTLSTVRLKDMIPFLVLNLCCLVLSIIIVTPPSPQSHFIYSAADAELAHGSP